MSNINITVTEQDPINVSIASPEVQNVDVTGQSISATVSDGDKGDIVVTGNGTVWTLDPNALATRVPYTGATSDVNLGEFGIQLGNLEFDTSPTNAPTGAGSMVWNDTEGTVDLVLKGGSLVLPIGQKQVIRAVNGTGGNLTRVQYRAVKITGAQGQRLQVSLARADNDANSKDTIGIVGEDISNNQTGFIVSSGLIEEINTTGSLQGETWADGDTLYLSGTTYGVITNVKPSAPTHTVILGFVVYAHANHGKIYVKVDNGYELDELHNVNVSTAASGDYLRYNGTTWVDATISAADLPTGIDAAKIATGTVSNTEFGYLDGVTSAIQTQLNGKQATLTNPVTGTGTTNYLAKFTGASTIGDSQIFDNGTSVGIGTTSPSATYKFDVLGAGRVSGIFQVTAAANYPVTITTTTQSATTAYSSTGGSFFVGMDSSGGTAVGSNAAYARLVWGQGAYPLVFATDSVERMRIFAAGNITVGGTTDAGYKLDIQGTLRNTTSAYFATSSGGVGIGTTTLGAALDINAALTSDYATFIRLRNSASGTSQTKNAIEWWDRTTTITASMFGTRQNIAGNWAGDFLINVQQSAAPNTSASSLTTMVRFDGQSQDIRWSPNGTEAFRMTSVNFGIGQFAFGTSATKTLAIGSGVAPTTSPADAFQLYSADITAGNAAPHFRTEGGAVVKLYQQTTGVGAAAFVANSGTAVNDASTFGGYTLKQIVQALQNAGFLA